MRCRFHRGELELSVNCEGFKHNILYIRRRRRRFWRSPPLKFYLCVTYDSNSYIYSCHRSPRRMTTDMAFESHKSCLTWNLPSPKCNMNLLSQSFRAGSVRKRVAKTNRRQRCGKHRWRAKSCNRKTVSLLYMDSNRLAREGEAIVHTNSPHISMLSPPDRVSQSSM